MAEDRFEQIADSLKAPLLEEINSQEISLGLLLDTYKRMFEELEFVQGIYAAYVYDSRKHPKSPTLLSVRVTANIPILSQLLDDELSLDDLINGLSNEIINLGCRSDVRAVYPGSVPKGFEGYVKLWERQTPG